MEWVKQFYQTSFEGMKNDMDVNDFHVQLVEKVEDAHGSSPKKILELGAGGGQFAVAAAQRGHEVTAIELVSVLADHIKKLAQQHGVMIRVVEGDFYDVQLEGSFDVICYWDGFGVGTDDDQSRLLKRIDDWLAQDGCALIEVYTPWYWSKVSGQEMKFNNVYRKYGYDFQNHRMLDTWKVKGHEAPVTQSLKCYRPDEFISLLDHTNLTLSTVEAGGSLDYETWKYHEKVQLEDAMSYCCRLSKS